MSIKPLALPYLLLASGIKIVCKDREHDSSVQKHFPSFNFSNMHRKCTLLERYNAFFSTLKFVFFFSALVSPSLKAGKEKAFNENFATSALNLFCSSFKKLSPKAEETAAPAQAALWAVSHLLWSTSLAYRQQPGSMETPGTG